MLQTKRKGFLYLSILVLFLGCSKTEPRSYEYWNNLVNEKRGEINTLVQSVSCSDIEEFEIIKMGSYYLVHPSVKKDFDRLQAELAQLQKESDIAYNREGLIGGPAPAIPSHPVRKVCENGKPKLVYVKDLSIEEINTQLPMKYNEIKTFYKDNKCTDGDQWVGRYIIADCRMEAIAVSKTIRYDEAIAKIDIYNQMMTKKMLDEKPKCDGASVPIQFEKVFKTTLVRCEDGTPVAIEE